MNLPNLITLGRLFSVPVAIWLILAHEMAAACLLFIAAGISDAVDGFIARHFDCQTKLGAVLDAVADKALLVSVYITLGITEVLPNWVVILVASRDAMILGGFLVLQAIDLTPRMEPLLISKANTVLQIALAGFMLGRAGFGFHDPGIALPLIYSVGVSTVLSGAAYIIRWTRDLAGAETTG